MSLSKNYLLKLLIPLILVFLAGCSATVPQQVVELSYTLGNDLQAMQSSYRELIRTHFESLRAQTISYLENRWIPIFLEDFIQSGGLIESVRNPNSTEVLEDVQLWTEVAIEEIEDKKKELLGPIDQSEYDLMTYVDEAFDKLILANSTITAHLNSIKKVQKIEDDILNSFNLKDLREQIKKSLTSASQQAQKGIDNLKKMETKLKTLEKKREK